MEHHEFIRLLEGRGLTDVTHDTTDTAAEKARIAELTAQREDSGLTKAEREQLRALKHRCELSAFGAEYGAAEGDYFLTLVPLVRSMPK